ncbi:disulfide bond formation protein B [Bartonella sp. CB178]|uniref:disulfide bond formation protein B n=1 Tax=Bartonella sp. CB178 TaxID=3112255 RepID=UPI00300DEAC2
MMRNLSLRHILHRHLYLKPSKKEQGLWAFFLIFCLSTTIGIALGFEHIGGYIPCNLCLIERFPYYISLPFLLLAGLGAWFSRMSFGVQFLFFCVFVLMILNLILALYHVGIEYSLWPAPPSCGSSATILTTDVNQLLSQLNNTHPPSCSEASVRFLLLSFAGWNAISGLFYASISFYVASKGILSGRNNFKSEA